VAPSPTHFLPLAPHDFQVLLGLTDGPRHAYGLARAVEDAEDGGVRLELGSLYRILARLTTQGLIADANGSREPGGSDSRRRYYRLTTLGRRVAEAETARLERVLAFARRRRLAQSRIRE
jgi:DNA-binding PadR family transcriptional regulator